MNWMRREEAEAVPVSFLKVTVPSSLQIWADGLAPPDAIFINIDNNSN